MKDQRVRGERKGRGSRVCHVCQLAFVEDTRCERMVWDSGSLLCNPTTFSRLILIAMGIIFKPVEWVTKDQRTSVEREHFESRLMVEMLDLASLVEGAALGDV